MKLTSSLYLAIKPRCCRENLDIRRRTFEISTLGEGECSPSRSGRFNTGEKTAVSIGYERSLANFRDIWYLRNFSKICRGN